MVACGKNYEDLEKDRTTIESFFEGYFNKMSEEEKVAEMAAYGVVGSVYRYVLNDDREDYADAAVVAQGDVVEFYYEAYSFTTNLNLAPGNYNPQLIFATNRPETLDFLCNPGTTNTFAAWDRTLWDSAPTVATVGSTTLVEGVSKGLPGLREGDHVWLVFASDLGFGEKELGTVGRNQILAYRIYIEKVTK